ncbi:MAG: GIY-YIG nuclease family protein [Brumimicrobium sp.]
MFYTYILYSAVHDRYYIGQTNDITKRLIRHNAGNVRSTKPFRPWEIVYYEEFETRKESMNREAKLKSWKSVKELKKLISTFQ